MFQNSGLEKNQRIDTAVQYYLGHFRLPCLSPQLRHQHCVRWGLCNPALAIAIISRTLMRTALAPTMTTMLMWAEGEEEAEEEEEEVVVVVVRLL